MPAHVAKHVLPAPELYGNADGQFDTHVFDEGSRYVDEEHFDTHVLVAVSSVIVVGHEATHVFPFT